MLTSEKIHKLAVKVQLEIKEEEMLTYVETLKKLGKLLVRFRQTKLPKLAKPLVRIDTGFFTRKDLKQLAIGSGKRVNPTSIFVTEEKILQSQN